MSVFVISAPFSQPDTDSTEKVGVPLKDGSNARAKKAVNCPRVTVTSGGMYHPHNQRRFCLHLYLRSIDRLSYLGETSFKYV